MDRCLKQEINEKIGVERKDRGEDIRKRGKLIC
jgi:hypothetical protein